MQAASARESARRLVYKRMAVAAAAAVLLLVVGLGLWRVRVPAEPAVAQLYTLSGASPAVVRGGTTLVTPSPSGPLPLPFSSQVATEPASSSLLKLLSGVEVTVGAETSLTLPDARDASSAREELVLALGLIRVRVPKLPRGHVFSIRTPNTLVSVHGTAFSVEVTKPGQSAPPRTRVVVTEGTVSVQNSNREILLEAGTEWASSGDAPPSSSVSWTVSKPAVVPLAPRASQKSEREAASVAVTPVDRDAVGDGTTSQTELASQNRLFAEAMRVREQGDQAMTVRLLDDFIRRYPTSPLAQDAHVERFRSLARMGDRAATARAARTYLALYANGFAREEARDLSLKGARDP